MHLHIQNFKCFSNVDIRLNDLTILAGANGNGKSTCIQALLFFRKTIEQLGALTLNENNYFELDENFYDRFKESKLIPLNGGYCLMLGNSNLVINKLARLPIAIAVRNDDETDLSFIYEYDDFEPQLWLKVSQVRHGRRVNELSLLSRSFYYLNAERLGPRVSQEIRYSDYYHVGWQGEFTAQVLDRENGYWKIPNERKFESSGSSFLRDQVNFWLSFIIPGTRVSVKTDTKTLSGQIFLENAFTSSEPTIATNLGFGISYVLPIVVTGLVAEKGSCMIVENPEAHLHPAAQSRIGRFISMVARSGVQVIIETHSDHVINGIQIAVSKGEIPNRMITINYFSEDENNYQPSIKPISISTNGELSEWPKGFFDQTQIDFAELFKRKDQ